MRGTSLVSEFEPIKIDTSGLSDFIVNKKGADNSNFRIRLPKGVVISDELCEYYLYKGYLMNKDGNFMIPICLETQKGVFSKGVICGHKNGTKHFVNVEPSLLYETAEEYPDKKHTMKYVTNIDYEDTDIDELFAPKLLSDANKEVN